jgi:hypothetical protein
MDGTTVGVDDRHGVSLLQFGAGFHEPKFRAIVLMIELRNIGNPFDLAAMRPDLTRSA